MLAATNKVQFRGVPVEYGDFFVIIPPLTFGQMQDNLETIDHIVKVTLEERELTLEEQNTVLEEKLKLAHLALQRNYPQITIEDVKQVVNMENIHQVTTAFFGANKTTKKVKDVGEIEPVASPSQT